METVAVSIFVALVGGVAIGFQNPLAGFMGDRIGLLESAFIIHLGGTLLAALLLILVPGSSLSQWRTLPWYALGAGALGVLLVASIGFTIPRIGVAATVGLIVAAQLTIGVILDHYGLLGFDIRKIDVSKIAGMVLLMGGAWMILRR